MDGVYGVKVRSYEKMLSVWRGEKSIMYIPNATSYQAFSSPLSSRVKNYFPKVTIAFHISISSIMDAETHTPSQRYR